LPEDLALFDSVTIFEHLLMAGSVYELGRAETEKRAEQLLDYLDLLPAKHTFVDQASTGMRKKCALAMALIHNPQVLFLDEPFEGIDPVSSRDIKDLLLELAGKGVTIFITSHILEVVERLVQRFAIIVSGEIVTESSLDDVLQAGQTLEEVFFKHVGRRSVRTLEWVG
jgi:ABC-2 type transport system ATP-binding protein